MKRLGDVLGGGGSDANSGGGGGSGGKSKNKGPKKGGPADGGGGGAAVARSKLLGRRRSSGKQQTKQGPDGGATTNNDVSIISIEASTAPPSLEELARDRRNAALALSAGGRLDQQPARGRLGGLPLASAAASGQRRLRNSAQQHRPQQAKAKQQQQGGRSSASVSGNTQRAHKGRGAPLSSSDRTDRTVPLDETSSRSTQTYPLSLHRDRQATSAAELRQRRHVQTRMKNSSSNMTGHPGGGGADRRKSQPRGGADDEDCDCSDDGDQGHHAGTSASALAWADDSFFVKKTSKASAAMQALGMPAQHPPRNADPAPPVYMDVVPPTTSLSPMSSFGSVDGKDGGHTSTEANNQQVGIKDGDDHEAMEESVVARQCPFHNHSSQAVPPPPPQRQSLDLEQLETGEKVTAESFEIVNDEDQPRHTVGCTPHECHGAMMDKSGFSAVGDAYSQPLQTKMAEATAFLRQFAAETSHLPTSQDLQDRIADVTNDISAYGFYRHTHEELEFGCRLAWRNSGRCIMRKVSFNLELRDCRSVKTSQECYDQIVEHLHYAGNGGAIKPVISIFPQKGDGLSAPVRVWNRQLIGYAAYQRQDGSVMGDPVNLSFTALCVKLGWTPPSAKSDFDILPLIISDNIVGHDRPRVFDIPADAILEVPIHHPEHELFSSLNLRWYALPAISNMGVDIGGVYYQTCPFNGWYQVTEIGRDFLDKQRYDLAEAAAIACGIQRSKIGVWRDRVQVEVHNAILHSFAKASVTLVDHHTASDSFIDFHREEIGKRGRCPADWVWVTPPAGGSMTKVFHQEMVNFIVKPIYRPNVDKCLEAGLAKIGPIVLDDECKAKSSFSIDTKAVVYDKIVLCFGSETGTSQRFITRLSTDLDALGERVVGPIPLDDLPNHFPTPRCKDRTLILVAASTTGVGIAPSHAKLFLPRLENMMGQSGTLNTTSFSVLSLGNSAYTQSFAKFGFDVHDALESIGIMPVLSVRIADELMDQELSFDAWRRDLLGGSSGIIYQEDVDAFAVATTKPSKSDARRKVTLSYQGFAQVIQSDTKQELEKLYKQAEYTPWSRVQGLLGRSTDLFCFEVDHAQSSQLTNLRPGDHVALYPENLDDSVDFTLRNVDGLDLSTSEARNVLKKWIDLARPVSTAALADLWDATRNDRAKYVISSIMRTSTKDETEKSVIDLINELPPGSIPYQWIVTSAPAMDPRFYSIASISHEERTISICQSVYTFASGQAGTTSRWLRSLQADDKATAVFSRTDLHLPDDEDAPCIMIATGTGIAPFRSFWMSGARNPMYLFFGCRTRSDLPFASEIASLERAGRIKPYIAYSREMSNKMHIQDMLALESEMVLSLLHNPNTCVYICGSPDMASTVQNRLLMTLCNGSHIQRGMNMNQAIQKLVIMKQQKRLITEVYGAISTGDDAMHFAWKEATARVVGITSGLERLVLPRPRAKEEFKSIRPTKKSSWADQFRPECSAISSEEGLPVDVRRNSEKGSRGKKDGEFKKLPSATQTRRASSDNVVGVPRTESLLSIPETVDAQNGRGQNQRMHNSFPTSTAQPDPGASNSHSAPSSPFVPARPRLHRRESWMGSFTFGSESDVDGDSNLRQSLPGRTVSDRGAVGMQRSMNPTSRRASDGDPNVINRLSSSSRGVRRASMTNIAEEEAISAAAAVAVPRRASTLGLSNPSERNHQLPTCIKAERQHSGGAA